MSDTPDASSPGDQVSASANSVTSSETTPARPPDASSVAPLCDDQAAASPVFTVKSESTITDSTAAGSCVSVPAARSSSAASKDLQNAVVDVEGSSSTVAEGSPFPSYPSGFQPQATTANEGLDMLRKWLSPLSKEQLVELLAVACSSYQTVFGMCTEAVAQSPAARRLMVRNVCFDTTDEAFRRRMEDFGEIDDCTIVRTKEGRSKGFGFVTFKYLESATTCMETSCTLDGKLLMVKLAAGAYTDTEQRKLFIRNLSDATDSEVLRREFEKCGELEDCVVVKNHKGISKGYGFVTFKTNKDAFRAVLHSSRIVDGRMVFVHFAVPTPKGTPGADKVGERARGGCGRAGAVSGGGGGNSAGGRLEPSSFGRCCDGHLKGSSKYLAGYRARDEGFGYHPRAGGHSGDKMKGLRRPEELDGDMQGVTLQTHMYYMPNDSGGGMTFSGRELLGSLEAANAGAGGGVAEANAGAVGLILGGAMDMRRLNGAAAPMSSNGMLYGGGGMGQVGMMGAMNGYLPMYNVGLSGVEAAVVPGRRDVPGPGFMVAPGMGYEVYGSPGLGAANMPRY